MNLNHLALPVRNVSAEQAFYCRYFGFRPIRGDGFLANDEGFVLVLDPVENRPQPPDRMHFGFFAGSRAEVRDLYTRMQDDGVSITTPLSEAHGMLTFFCSDPEGYEVEIRAFDKSGLEQARRQA